ncbi:chemotaxis protein CheC [Bariatricus massiliensis]|uniref:Chemotaxis protein CheC n=1 Tax=Bariatricus massiliensis TaxID=1745713 RepID=A0ABS8DLA7_9FIRM|nr:chemotaxis protein CheC [Bariatricus massiliensis]MCB7306093.1 chemotaxis protein CheC [Bariatricus massiliensis]MCB7376538.1 chemotaxis protein CheC [Bariatricus massiliensis]MCB7389236.1 chemotaxis protein CheC [Bariatricus massiliensis]MCB7413409.1 chemotaxis protein CheC [Bariatricus massiliensis]MCQ5255263.1 chemotaxis protein CheC [Bariatricus massiliensis]
MDYDYDRLDEMSIDILKELGNIGTGNAVTAMSQLMQHPLEMGLPSFQIIKYEEMHGILDETEELQAGIIIETEGELRGIFLFLLKESFTDKILRTMLGAVPENLLDLNDMEKSALCEVGNIMCGSYISALSKLTNLMITVSVPDICIDMAGAILSVPIIKGMKSSDNALLIENTFSMDGDIFYNRILFFPEPDSLEKIFHIFGG